jgi:predicted DCC family thiol-disulfide oxidoreductase YuxK
MVRVYGLPSAPEIVIPLRIMYRPTTLLYDPDCGICVATAGWLRERVAGDRLRPLPLTQAAEDVAVGELVEGRPLVESLHAVLPDGGVVRGGRAVLAAGRLVPHWNVLATLFHHRLGHALLEPVYRAVSRHRRRIGRLLGLPATCEVPC